ncbi:TPA: hypothetical protein ACOEOC_000979 [Stenotrophomonas maltophilia]|uniref:Sel1 repeat family protein n=1 Tax=Stenotrophomonas maltophilia TaxID=40324 RepID=A0AAI9CFU0_STEMA|nr:hypothetical protein [Stenotrophomonas maltophilia]EKZ1925849.1 hypothetical protein [Stenotrophomonas maltophilia]EMB2744886.1 hypothetical protein [Stenotrophomonas maltophilia]MBH1687840.1 hypothetical protein [Stenotrophomonas maltophilia]MBH1815673.1 hypothetical protein [Stenotrophomonas maltophilia]MBH1821724.1 hypothetical protein [Stenotrophomonas maltophilia]
MGRKFIAVISVIAVSMLGAAGLYLAQHHSRPIPTGANELADIPQSDTRAVRGDSGTASPIRPATSVTKTGNTLTPADAEAAAAYELVEINLRCQIDREASSLGGHVRSTTEDLCKDLSLEPLTREEVFKAITYAAEHGNIRAQLDYSLYASRIFEDEQNSLNPDVIREYKENTVRFLESAGRAGESQAYVRLSDLYKNGALASKDPVMAYAYAEAYFRTGSSRYGASFLNNAKSGLDGAQLRRGKEIADQILNERSASK